MIENEKLIEQYKLLHERSPKYGTTSIEYLKVLQDLINIIKPPIVIDYGCGKSKLIDRLDGIQMKCRYDPAIPEFSHKINSQMKFNLLLCTDVLEHIPSEDVDNFLTYVSSLAPVAVFAICYRHSYEFLPNGDPCHCTVRDREWWFEMLMSHYNDATTIGGTKNTDLILVKK